MFLLRNVRHFGIGYFDERQARHVGLKPKSAAKRQKYIVQPPGGFGAAASAALGGGAGTLGPSSSAASGAKAPSVEDLDDAASADADGLHLAPLPLGPNGPAPAGVGGGVGGVGGGPSVGGGHSKTLERVVERSYCKDYQRLNLAPAPSIVPGRTLNSLKLCHLRSLGFVFFALGVVCGCND